MYNEINKNDLPHDKIDRGLMIEILDKMIQIADWYFDNYCSDINKARQIYENNLLCYRIKTSKTINEPTSRNTVNEPTSRNTVLSLLGGVWTFVDCLHSCPERLFTDGQRPAPQMWDSMFMNTIGLCSVFEFINKKVDANLEHYYKLLGVSDGQPYTSKHYFFNDGTLTKKIQEFLSLDVAKLEKHCES